MTDNNRTETINANFRAVDKCLEALKQAIDLANLLKTSKLRKPNKKEVYRQLRNAAANAGPIIDWINDTRPAKDSFRMWAVDHDLEPWQL